MLDYTVYRLVHLFGLFVILMSLGGLTLWATQQVGQTPVSATQVAIRKRLNAVHGLGLFFSLLGGFGMLAKLEIHWPWPNWVIVKFACWLLLGGISVLPRRKPELAGLVFVAVLLIATLAAYTAIFKPMSS